MKMYIKRNSRGEIEMASRVATPDCRESIAIGSPELIDFVGGSKAPRHDELEASDMALVRVVEDLIELLMNKGAIGFSDLPHAARDKLLSRQYLRSRGNSAVLLSEGKKEVSALSSSP